MQIKVNIGKLFLFTNIDDRLSSPEALAWQAFLETGIKYNITDRLIDIDDIEQSCENGNFIVASDITLTLNNFDDWISHFLEPINNTLNLTGEFDKYGYITNAYVKRILQAYIIKEKVTEYNYIEIYDIATSKRVYIGLVDSQFTIPIAPSKEMEITCFSLWEALMQNNIVDYCFNKDVTDYIHGRIVVDNDDLWYAPLQKIKFNLAVTGWQYRFYIVSYSDEGYSDWETIAQGWNDDNSVLDGLIFAYMPSANKLFRLELIRNNLVADPLPTKRRLNIWSEKLVDNQYLTESDDGQEIYIFKLKSIMEIYNEINDMRNTYEATYPLWERVNVNVSHRSSLVGDTREHYPLFYFFKISLYDLLNNLLQYTDQHAYFDERGNMYIRDRVETNNTWYFGDYVKNEISDDVNYIPNRSNYSIDFGYGDNVYYGNEGALRATLHKIPEYNNRNLQDNVNLYYNRAKAYWRERVLTVPMEITYFDGTLSIPMKALGIYDKVYYNGVNIGNITKLLYVYDSENKAYNYISMTIEKRK